MNRRRFLRAALVAAAPLFLAEAFAAAPALTDVAALSDAFARARASGRPLLVIVIPSDGDFSHFRGQEWGRLLNEGGDDVMALLGQVEVVCARDTTVRAFAPQATGAEPWLWALQTDRIGGWAVPGTPAPLAEEPPAPEFTGVDAESLRAYAVANQRNQQALLRPLADALGGALAPLLRPTTSAERAGFARQAIATLRDAAPRNSAWAHVGGCGFIEMDTSRTSIDCGMAMRMMRYGRLLYFIDSDNPIPVERW